MQEKKTEEIASLLKAMGHPIRFRILDMLKEKGALSVGKLHSLVQTSNANVTRHLNTLRDVGAIDYRRDGATIINYISDSRVIELIDKLSELYEHDKS